MNAENNTAHEVQQQIEKYMYSPEFEELVFKTLQQPEFQKQIEECLHRPEVQKQIEEYLHRPEVQEKTAESLLREAEINEQINPGLAALQRSVAELYFKKAADTRAAQTPVNPALTVAVKKHGGKRQGAGRKKGGGKSPEDLRGHIATFLDPEEKAELDTYAKEMGWTRSAAVRDIVLTFLRLRAEKWVER